MENAAVLEILLLGISIFEIWIYYQLLFGILIEKQYMKTIDKVVMWVSIIGVGVLLEISRKYIFFSDSVFLFIVSLMILITWLVQRKQLLLIIGIAFSYCAVTALLDFLFAFCGISFLGKKFNEIIYFDGVYVEKIAVYLCTRILLTIIVLIIKKSDMKKELPELRNILLVISVVFVLLVRTFQLLLANMVFGTIHQDGKIGILASVVAILLTSFIGIILSENKMIKKENDFLIIKEEMEQQKYEEVTAALEKNRELIHDTKNHYLMINEYERNQEYEKLHQYVDELKNEIIKTDSSIYTGNRVVDLILSQKKLRAEQENIAFEVQTIPFSDLPFKEREICTLFGNLLDNAIEACEIVEGKRWISIKIEKQNHLFFLQIINTIKDVPKEKEKGFWSSKKNKELHGYGLKSVQRIVDAYEGNIAYKIVRDTFVVKISFFDVT